jgi:hypothetical protein
VTGRLANTAVERAIVISQGDGCVVCGVIATSYATTTIGDSGAAIMIQLPVCEEHLGEAKRYPSVFTFFASLFDLPTGLDTLKKSSVIPDDLIPVIHSILAAELDGHVGNADKRKNGWNLCIDLETGWKWILRIGSLTDYAYMLFEPGVAVERYRADSAPDHPDLRFFPIHEHQAPGKRRDTVCPSFLYGVPLLDVTRLREIGRRFGAYPPSAV